jgi:hypothetical protein
MRSLTLVVFMLLPSIGDADEPVSGVIVSVYRPLEMEARRVKVARKVFVQSTADKPFSSRLVGQILTIYRQHAVPAQVAVSVDKDGEARLNVPTKTKAPADFQQASPETLKPLENGRPAGFSQPRHQQSMQMPIYLGNGNGAIRSVSPITPAVVEGTRIREKVGQIRVLSVDGDVAIAEVLEDGLRTPKTTMPMVRPVEATTVSAGDVAEGVIKQIVIKPKAIPLSKAEKTALKKERERIRKLSKPKKKKGKYERKVMQYDL